MGKKGTPPAFSTTTIIISSCNTTHALVGIHRAKETQENENGQMDTEKDQEREKPGKQERENKNVSSDSGRRATRWIMMQEK